MNKALNLKTLDSLAIGAEFVSGLPGDPVTDNYTRQVPSACYSFVNPVAFPKARLIACSEEMLATLGLDPAECGTDLFTQVFSGTRLLSDMRPHACCYGGHQFGHWAGQLGDGRAINLGEVTSADGQHWTLQLKGAGPTPYSRSADGLAVLRSSIREFLCSEAMHHLGIPTTRALSLIGTGESVVRDMFYDGHPKREPGAVVCRVAPSFVRFGSFEIFAARKEHDILKRLADFTIARDFPHLGQPGKDTYQAWFREICLRTADLLVHWMRVGFVHGVMNTDNMSITGLTIDYGPYGWLESYDPDWTPNTTDFEGRRYRFGNQPMIALWNLVQLANAIYPLIGETGPLESVLEEYKKHYENHWLDMMRSKLGFATAQAGDEALALNLIGLFRLAETDMTLFFRYLAEVATAESPEQAIAHLIPSFYDEGPGSEARPAFEQWLDCYQARLQQEHSRDDERRAAMNRINPLYVLRNYLAQLAIDKSEQGDHSGVHELMEVLKNPYTEQADKTHLAGKRPDWARTRPGCSMLSCSS
jgi:uncharacterized protein YdiU (UPF0061 family)